VGAKGIVKRDLGTLGNVCDKDQLQSNDGKVVMDHFMPLHCICMVMIGGCVLTCILYQGIEVVMMPKEVWRSLGVGLCLDHTLNMESVNMTKM
jgi:hypothetical protein